MSTDQTLASFIKNQDAVLKVHSQLVLAPGLRIAHDVPRRSQDFKSFTGSRVLILVRMDLNAQQQFTEINIHIILKEKSAILEAPTTCFQCSVQGHTP